MVVSLSANVRNRRRGRGTQVVRERQLATHLRRSSGRRWTAAMGHEDAFPRPRLSARCRFSQGTFAGTRGNGRDAPKPDTRRKPRVQRGFLEADVRDPVTTSTWLCPPVVTRYTPLRRDQRSRYDRI